MVESLIKIIKAALQSRVKNRTLLFDAYQGKIANCVPASASAQHIEAPINTNNNLPDS
jgi:hypothetical protein